MLESDRFWEVWPRLRRFGAGRPCRLVLWYPQQHLPLIESRVAAGAETAVTMQVKLNYTVAGTSVAATDQTSAALLLVNQPSPYMVDIDPTIPPPGPPNPYWLSTDTRVFKIKQNDSIAGIQQQTDPFGFITGLVGAFNKLPNDINHPFLTQLSQDENASQLELSPTLGGTPVFNYAVAKIRYRGNVPAQNVTAFFRAFKTMVSALDYDQTSGLTGNYRRSGNTAGSVPLLGIQSNEIASIPFFAQLRVDTKTQSMMAQVDDPINTQISFQGNGQEEVIYCGVWLDINDINNKRFPQDPSSDPGGVNGPYQNTLLTIQQLVTGFHYCLVAEIFFWPPGTTTDPIPVNSTPASSASERQVRRAKEFKQGSIASRVVLSQAEDNINDTPCRSTTTGHNAILSIECFAAGHTTVGVYIARVLSWSAAGSILGPVDTETFLGLTAEC
jgi:hypothetical protein